ncbi:hypothetical protein OEZ85_000920 [Tetradesmus obliquus]|uniref:Protein DETOXIFICATION n=1 Tax=Tetradesmus obliquus TaxID=3088 RepID=A0ABY8UM56_TETOB|nr:hypothetical protein OEZ85_000920 [Tetradesmus obliquus]
MSSTAAEEQQQKDEEQPLLERPEFTLVTEDAVSADGRWSSEVRRLLHLAVPTSANGVLMYSSRLITLSQVGWRSSRGLSSLALAQTVYNITGLSLVVGIASGITTFVGHAHGAAESRLKGLILQRGAATALATALLPLLGWIQLPRLLALLGQQQVIASGAAAYIRLICPALLLSAGSFSLSNYMSAQAVVWPLVAVSGVTMSLTPLLNYVFMQLAGWGWLGAGGTMLAVHCVEVVLLAAAAAWHNARQPLQLRPWGGFSREALSQLRPYLSVALPGAAMLCLDWWAFEALTLLAGLLPDAEVAVAAIGICFGLHVLAFMLLDGLAVAVAVRVANELGAGRPVAARDAVAAGVALSAAVAACCMAPLGLLPGRVARVFSNDPQVVSIVLACLPPLLLSLAGDALNVVLSGCIRGAGRQALGSAVNLGSYWCFGLPLSALLALHWGLGAPGLWWGMAATSAVQGVVLAGVVGCMDWQGEAARSVVLVRSQSSSHGGQGS